MLSLFAALMLSLAGRNLLLFFLIHALLALRKGRLIGGPHTTAMEALAPIKIGCVVLKLHILVHGPLCAAPALHGVGNLPFAERCHLFCINIFILHIWPWLMLRVLCRDFGVCYVAGG